MSNEIVLETGDAEAVEVEIGEESSYQFKIGEKFTSFEAFKSKLKHHKNAILPSFGKEILEPSPGQGKGESIGPLSQN